MERMDECDVHRSGKTKSKGVHMREQKAIVCKIVVSLAYKMK